MNNHTESGTQFYISTGKHNTGNVVLLKKTGGCTFKLPAANNVININE